MTDGEIFGIPIRLDATLCDPDEIWLEAADGTAIRVFPPPEPVQPDQPDQE